ncbi:saccharopine dehydrogenase family protein [uncultured Jatrophihabitans sp.]|uniref:saccharopine dehydrogenase family protein n=1 Tax=uncultured Jatrophihabitans sp. TaxID=1610747 RepID=UPI0035CB46B6
MDDRRYDLVLWGATGFVGRLIARHLADQLRAEQGGRARIALAGRSQARLQALADELDVDWPLIVGDATDERQLAKLAASTAVVATTVGPYLRRGLPLVLACARAGTSYCDLSGETLFVHSSIAAAHQQAADTGARITHACGFDSVPSDLAVLLLHQRVTADGEGTLTRTINVLTSAWGGISRGTLDSLLGDRAAARSDPAMRAIADDPWALSTQPGAQRPARTDNVWPTRDALTGRWVAPSLFGPFNERIVRRSATLLDAVDGDEHGYGQGFDYHEYLGASTTPVAPLLATGLAAGLSAARAVLSSPLPRALVSPLLPGPGQGPSARTQRRGFFRMEITARTTTGAEYLAVVSAHGDPGYAATAVMFAQSALALAVDAPSAPGGVLTPAVAVGATLPDRLRRQGFVLSVERLPTRSRSVVTTPDPPARAAE